MKKASLLLPSRLTFLWNGSSCIQKFIFEVRFYFQVRRGIKLPISARDWHVLVARFSEKKKNRYIYNIWHHRIRKPPFWSVHTEMRSLRFQKPPLWTAFLKSCVFDHRFHRIRVNGAQVGDFKSSFEMYNYCRQNSEFGFNACKYDWR